MPSAIVSEPVTTEALLAFPDNGMERWLVRGELKEKPMTVRNRLHGKVMASLTARLKNWRDSQPEPRGDVLCGEAGVRSRGIRTRRLASTSSMSRPKCRPVSPARP